MRRRTLAVATAVGLILGLVPAVPAGAGAAGVAGIRIKETRTRVKATGDGFVLRLSRRGIDVRIDEGEFGDPGTGNPIQRVVVDLTGRTLRPFECRGGTYTIRTGTFTQTSRFSRLARRPPPYTAGFATAFPGILTPFVGEIEGTATNAAGETFDFFVSDLAHEELTDRGFTSVAPIHGLFVDRRGRIRDRISLIGRFKSGPNGERARFVVEDRGTCRQRADLQFGPGSENAVVTGPFFVLPFDAPVTVPRR